jgi:hypothetical protein
MDLPFRIQTEPGAEPVVTVDGAFGAPGLELSHWPGNRTPDELRRPTSTGIALAFVDLPAARQAQLMRGCTALVTNHYDTDGLCAAWTLLRPDEASPRAEQLLAAAEAGDFFRHPSDAAFIVDTLVSAYADPARSPLAARFEGLADAARHELCYREGFERLAGWLDGEVQGERELWQPALDALHADLADLGRASRDDLVHLDLSVWTAGHGQKSRRHAAGASFDPGRHALFGSTRADRVLVLGPGAGGTTARLVINTTSWFDLPRREPTPRPDLGALAERLNRLEDRLGRREYAWHAQAADGAAPELWFGRPGAVLFAEHAPQLEPSRLPSVEIKHEVIEALRAVWALPA